MLGQDGQAIYLLRPHALQHILERPQASEVRLVVALLPLTPNSHETCVFQDPQMLRNSGEAHFGLPGDVARTPFAFPDESQDFSTAGLSYDLQHIHEVILVVIEMKVETSYNVLRT